MFFALLIILVEVSCNSISYSIRHSVMQAPFIYKLSLLLVTISFLCSQMHVSDIKSMHWFIHIIVQYEQVTSDVMKLSREHVININMYMCMYFCQHNEYMLPICD